MEHTWRRVLWFAIIAILVMLVVMAVRAQNGETPVELIARGEKIFFAETFSGNEACPANKAMDFWVKRIAEGDDEIVGTSAWCEDPQTRIRVPRGDQRLPFILHFWNPNCLPCGPELVELAAFSNRYPILPIVAVTINSERPEIDLFFMRSGFREQGHRLYLRRGPQRNRDLAGGHYRLTVLPTTLFVDADGIIIRRVDGGVIDWSSRKTRKFVDKFMRGEALSSKNSPKIRERK